MAAKATLASLVTADNLEKIAGAAIYARGLEYQCADMVSDLRVINASLSARVAGSSYPEYEVRLWVEDGWLDYSCTCPMGEDGATCKHVVAAGLAWLTGARTQSGKKVRPGKAPQDDTALLRDFLGKQDRDTLAAWLLAQCAADPNLHDEIRSKALLATAKPDMKAMKKAFDTALRIREFASWDQVRDRIRKARQLIAQVQTQLGETRAAQHAELAEYTVQRALAAYRKLDDSSGAFNDFVHEVGAWYLRALQDAGSAWPLKASLLFKLKQQDQWGFFALADYGPLLDKAEYRKYRKLVETEWDKVPAFKPDRITTGFADTSYYHIMHVMEEIAHYENDIDALVRIKSRQLGSPWAYLQVAEILKSAQRDDEALSFAERGLKAFPKRWDSRLVEFLLGEYGRRKQYDKALDLAWRHFADERDIEAYSLLKQVAHKQRDWQEWRQKALAHLGFGAPVQPGRDKVAVAYQLVEILLDEQDLDAALQAARARGANEDQWLRLAHICEDTKAQEAVNIYRRLLNGIVDRKNNQAYDHAVRIVVIVKRLMLKLGQKADFAAWLAELSLTHKAKRNFIQRLESKVTPA